jgi:hypothetical protein
MSHTNTKIWFLLLAALVLLGCESPQVVRQNEMAQARALVRAQYGGQLSPHQEAYLTAMLYDRMEADRTRDAAVSAQIIANGFQNAGNTIAEGSRYQPNYLTPTVQMPAMQIAQPVPIQNPQIDTPRYQLLNGASPGQIHY